MKPYLILLSSFIVCLLSVSEIALAEGENTWPQKIEKETFTVVIYQPQIESLSANKMESRAAISVRTNENPSPVFGAMWFDCRISTDKDERIVRLIDLKVATAKFPDVDEEHILILSALLEEEIPKWEMEFPLDQLLSDLDINEVAIALSEDFNNAPPEIIFTTTPSVLILVDGEPIYEAIEKSNYEKVVNTPFFIVRDTKSKLHYMKGGEYWYSSNSSMGEWDHIENVPKKLEKIAEEAMGDIEEVANDAEDEGDGIIPKIILRTTPAELLQSDGDPDFSPIEGTSLLYMSNTADDILMDIETQQYYILVAGRWYSSSSISDGPWSFVNPDKIPARFAEIPTESEMGSVRASIAGTQEAKEALLENQIPQTAEIDRKEAKLDVVYDGNPKFESVKGTEMKYAVNTEQSVLLIDNRYYCCDNAIWFESNSPSGPWVVSIVVPESVEEIPPESPVYNVKYVHIYESTPTVVYVGYTPGYVHSYSYRGCVYYGTGYYYRPWYGNYYYPRPVTYGYNVHYNPYTGWGFSYGVSYGWMAYGWHSPRYGYWGPAGYRHGYHYGYHHGYRSGYRAGYYSGQRASQPRPTPYGSSGRVASNNVYRNRSQGVKSTGGSHYDPKTGNRISSSDRSAKPTTQPADRANNMYTDKNGNVYRRDGNDWKKMDNGDRQGRTRETMPGTTERPSTGQQPSTRPGTTDRPSTGQQPSTRPSQPSTGQQPSTRPSQPSTRPSTPPNTGNLNKDYNSRNRGNERTQQYNQNRQNYQYKSPGASPSQRAAPSQSRSSSGRSGSSAGARRR